MAEPRRGGAEPGTDSDESSDRFTDASEGRRRAISVSPHRSPIPITRVERLDDEPAYGEVPGTDAYAKRTQDAVPDEVVTRSRSVSRVDPADFPPTPASRPIPRIVAIKIDPDTPAYGEEPGTEAYEKRKADPLPDEIVRSPDGSAPPPNPFSTPRSPTAFSYRSPSDNRASAQDESEVDESVAEVGDEDGFGDDFDEFEEGQEGNDDFGEFDDGFQQQGAFEDEPSPPDVSSQPLFPPLDWANIDDIDDLRNALEPYMTNIYPNAELADQIQSPPPPPQSLLSDRSLSLYSQLVAPPPLAPPNWLRSRIRRLFLVSLGVPVDLDEILPASKQKKLVLPSINLEKSPRQSTDSRGVGTVGRLKSENNDSSASVDATGKKSKTKRKDEPAEPALDMSEATRIARTTDVRLESMSDQELTQHVDRLEELMRQARAALAFWEQRKEGAIKEKEAFEGVIENLVKHARKVRK